MDLNILKKADLFEDLDTDELQLVARIAEVKSYPAEQLLFKEGQVAEQLYVIEAGWVRITKNVDEGAEELLVETGPGDYFGEMALVEDAPRSATARALTELTVIEIPKQKLLSMLDEHDKLAKKLLWKFTRILSRRLRGLHEKIEDLFIFTRIC